MSDDKCPTCKGPIKKTRVDPILGQIWHSTAAEQLEELRAANRELIRQHEEDKRRADVRAKAIRQTKQQLTDKERELTAANAVVDEVGATLDVEQKYQDRRIEMYPELYAAYFIYRKLQGGDGE